MVDKEVKDAEYYFEQIHPEIVFQLKLAATKELRALTIAENKAKALQEAHDTLFSEHQEAIGKHAELLQELDAVDDAGVIEAAEALAGHDQQKAAIRQKLHFVKIRLKTADEAVKKLADAKDQVCKLAAAKTQGIYLPEAQERAKGIMAYNDGFEKAMLTALKVDLKVGFLIMSKSSKPWLTLRLPELEDYT